jgi:hypothetical protein
MGEDYVRLRHHRFAAAHLQQQTAQFAKCDPRVSHRLIAAAPRYNAFPQCLITALLRHPAQPFQPDLQTNDDLFRPWTTIAARFLNAPLWSVDTTIVRAVLSRVRLRTGARGALFSVAVPRIARTARQMRTLPEGRIGNPSDSSCWARPPRADRPRPVAAPRSPRWRPDGDQRDETRARARAQFSPGQ